MRRCSWYCALPASIAALFSCPMLLMFAVCACTPASRSAPVSQRSRGSDVVMLLALSAAKAASKLFGWHVAHMTEGTSQPCCEFLLRGTWVLAVGPFLMRCPQ